MLLVGLVALAAVLGLVVFVGPAPSDRLPRHRPAPPLLDPPPVTPAPLPSGDTLADLAGGDTPVALDPGVASAPPVALDDVLAAPADFTARVFVCDNTAAALPEAWRGDRPDPSDPPGEAAQPPVVTMQAADAERLAPFRLRLLCRGRDLQAAAVQVYFDPETLAALPAIGVDTRVALQVLGLGHSGQLAARYVRIVAFARRPPTGDAVKADWLRVLLNPAAYLDHDLPCQLASWPQLTAPSSLSPAVARWVEGLALAASASETAAQKLVAVAACSDLRSLEVPVLLILPGAAVETALRLAPGAQVRARLLGSADNRLVLQLLALDRTDAPAHPTDLRRFLLAQPPPGKAIECLSMGLPLPQTLDAADPDVVRLEPGLLAPRKSWLVCAQPPQPPVHVKLFFRRGEEAQLLAIGRGTRVALDLLGTADSRLLARFRAVLTDPTDEAARADDLRQFPLLTEALRHHTLRCLLGAEMQAATPAQAPESTRRLFDAPTAGAPRLAMCVDGLRPFEGQRFLVYWPAGHPPSDDLPHTGAAIELRLRGMVNNLPVAEFVRRLGSR